MHISFSQPYLEMKKNLSMMKVKRVKKQIKGKNVKNVGGISIQTEEITFSLLDKDNSDINGLSFMIQCNMDTLNHREPMQEMR